MRDVVAAVVIAAALSGCTSSDGPPEGSAPAPSASVTATTSASPPATDTASCSAALVDTALPAQPGLPEPVARLRADMDAAARDCDYERLEELALAGDGTFTASFGDPGSPAEHWRREEESGREPMRMLRGVLRLSHAERDGRYLWPAAFGRDTWQDVTAGERAELETLYGDRDLRAFEQFGAYAGHRVVISADGDWTAFVSGD